MRSVFISALSPISINHLPSFMQCLCRASSICSQTLIGLTHRSLFRLRLHRWSSIGCQSCQRLQRKRWQRQRQSDSDSDCESNQLHRKVCQLGKSWAQGFWQLSWHGTKKRRHDTCLHRSKSRATATATATASEVNMPKRQCNETINQSAENELKRGLPGCSACAAFACNGNSQAQNQITSND